ncbi:MAG TPA: FAD binding domain-containing protein, partial [Ilumatobacteraceae bacterium]
MRAAYRVEHAQLVCVHMNVRGKCLVALPRSIEEALNVLADRPDLSVIAGGTDLMVGINAGRHVPGGWLSLRHLDELVEIDEHRDGSIVIGAGVTMATLAMDSRPMLRALSEAARTVGSPQIRSMATIGGNLATASPAGDALPPLLCGDASVELVSAPSSRRVPLADFLVGPKRTALRPGELIRGIHLPARPGEQLFTKVGPRNAMVIAVCSLSA